jgi:hypothetical protein
LSQKYAFFGGFLGNIIWIFKQVKVALRASLKIKKLKKGVKTTEKTASKKRKWFSDTFCGKSE